MIEPTQLVDIVVYAGLITAGAITFLNRVSRTAFLLLAKKSAYALPPRMDESLLPPVAFHLAISNEDPNVVIPTLESLLSVDYPDMIVIVVDNNTVSPLLWRPIADFCSNHSTRLFFHHVDQLRGYKAGALNYALDHTPSRYKYVAIVDADTIVAPTFLRSVMPHFEDLRLGALQTPLGFLKDPRQDPFHSRIFLIYRYFLSVYEPVASSMSAATFTGAMGVVRRDALQSSGSWRGYYLTEDMELTFRLFIAGYTTKFIDSPFGFSMPPPSARSFIQQHRRWNFGNCQVLRDYGLRFLWMSLRDRLARPLVLLSCAAIYLNLHTLVFSVGAAWFVAKSLAGSMCSTDEEFALLGMSITLSEVMGDTLSFFVVAAREKKEYRYALGSLISWWGLSYTTAASSVAVLVRRTNAFQITQKSATDAISNVDSSARRQWEIILILFLVGWSVLAVFVGTPLAGWVLLLSVQHLAAFQTAWESRR
jgi:cellulose synthase/poly-beta-1,6-N-acetylglucosamine synthase-like glycosyltransferase